MRWTLPALLIAVAVAPAAPPMQSASALAFGKAVTLQAHGKIK